MAEKIYTPLLDATREPSDDISLASGCYAVIDDSPLNLSHRNLTADSFDPGFVTGATGSLILDYNRFLTLPESICDKVHLKVLSVKSQLDIESICEQAKPALLVLPPNLSKLQTLSELILVNNALKSIPPSMSKMKHLQVLDLRMNLLEEFPECICYMKSLKTLQLCGNTLRYLPESITKLQHLQTLTASQNELVGLPENFGRLVSLQDLDLRSNRLTSLPQSMSKLQSLLHTKRLFLANNPLEYPPPDTVDMGTAAVLQFLQNNVERRTQSSDHLERRKTHVSRRITSREHAEMNEMIRKQNALVLTNGQYPDKVLTPRVLTDAGNWTKIRSLTVSSNSIDTIDPELKNLENLETLILDDNNITKFPDHVIRHMPRLRMLSLNKQTSPSMHGVYRHFRCLTRELIYINHLTHLHIAKNELQRVPEEIKYMKDLVELELTDNKNISVIPDGIGKLVQLKYLGLSGNCIKRLPPAIGQLKSLQVLRLSCNELQYLPDEICELKELMTLSLQKNQLMYLPLNFDKLKSLTKGKEKEYRSPLMEGRVFERLLNLRENHSIHFPSAACEAMTAQGVFDLYARLREMGSETMEEMLADARLLVKEKEVIEKRWRWLNEALLADLSRSIGFDWRNLGYNLDLSQEDIEQFLANHPRNLAGSITEMFIRWRDRCQGKKMEERAMVEGMLRAMEAIENRALIEIFVQKLKQKGWKQ